MKERHFYCMKCQAGKTVVGQSPVVFRNGALALKGECPSCKNQAYKIVSKDTIRNKIKDRIVSLAFLTFGLGIFLGFAIGMIAK